jgi:hypothetical protein
MGGSNDVKKWDGRVRTDLTVSSLAVSLRTARCEIQKLYMVLAFR